jgi:acetyl-CoA C-acetyltransferase
MSKVHSVLPKPVYLGAATRSPIGKFGGALKRFSAGELGALTLKQARTRAPEAAAPDMVIMGHGRQAGAGPNTARQATLFSGLPESVPAFTVNQACASGLCAIITASEKLAVGKARSIWAGGTESMSNTPYLVPQARWGQKLGHMPFVDGMYKDGLHCPMANMIMGETVESFIAKEMGISRAEQDAWAFESQKRASAAWDKGLFNDETFEIPAEGRNPGLKDDEHRRADTTLEALSKLAPVFDKAGSITAGNSSGITDGSAWVHLSTDKGAHAQVEIIDYETVALDPRRMGLGPIECTQRILKRQNLTVQDLEAVEINEAFAAMIVACQRTLKIPQEKLNQRGGSIAIGHPIGATGARITTTLVHTLKGKPGALGLATLCVSGGMGVALLVRAL